MTFDWTITLGNLLTTLITGVGIVWSVLKFLSNHLQHHESRILERLEGTEAHLNRRLDDISTRVGRIENTLMKGTP